MLKLDEIESLVPATFKNSDLIYVCVLDIEGQVYFASKRFEKLFKPNATVIQEKNFLDTLSKGDRPNIHDFFMKVVERPNHNFQIDLQHGNTPITWEFSVMKNEEGDFSGILGLGYPKTSTHQASLEEKTFPKDVSLITDVFFQLNHSWEIVSLNEHAEKYFGYSENQLLGKTIWQIYPDQNIYRFALEFKNAKETKTLRIFEEYSSINGKWYKVFVIPRPTGLDIIFKDISEIQNLSGELKKSKLTLRNLLENAEECIFFVGKDLKIFGFNGKAEKLISSFFCRSLKIGDKFLSCLFEGLDEFFLKHNERIFKGESVVLENEVIHPRLGDKIWFNHKFYPLQESDKRINGFIYICKDIHEEKVRIDKIKNQNRLMRDILHRQSTTLRSPLSSILGLLELIDKSQMDKENKKYFSYLKPLAQELDKVIRENSKQVSDLD
ncbi:PAS domain S-box protein [Shivajiella indica]|uniref:histidine kinase n=1 Tax=Shivajiella indica TaxID=872115 RepID=A0ABW5B6A0_9BACT